MPFTIVPFLLLVIPIMEIAVFILIGGQIGVFPTLGMIVVTAIIGSILLRWQGFGLLARIQNEMNTGSVPARELIHGVMILIAGVLLLTPGFVTDTLGFALFVPQLRDAGWAMLKSRFTVVDVSGAPHPGSAGPQGRRGPQDASTIDLDEDDYVREPDPTTPWRDPAEK